MSGISYLRSLPQKYRTWRRFRTQFHPAAVAAAKVPSETYVKYPPMSGFQGRKVLNLGCGTSTYAAPNVTNLDAVLGKGVNVVHDLAITPLPFEDESFDLIIANHVMEHIPNWWKLFQECARILKTHGTLEIWVPPVSSDSSFTYRDHINSIGILSFAGTGTFRNPGCNLVVGEENKLENETARLFLQQHLQRPYMKWWLHFAPDWFVSLATTHLRNTVTEECFLFKKFNHAS